MLLPFSHYALALLLVAVFTSGCERNEIKVYDVPKEPPAPMTQSNPAAARQGPASPTQGPRLKWKTPDGWEEVQPGEFRVASFRVKGKDGKQADVSVIPLPGAAGGDLSNVNRWRGQVGQKPVTAEEMKQLAESIELDGQPAALYEQNGENAAGESTGILAVIQHRNGTAWFLKMTGDSQVVAQKKTAFVEFLKSIQFVSGGPPSTPPSINDGTLPAGHPDISGVTGSAAPGAMASAGKPKWQAPSGWKEVPAGQFLVAKFTIGGDGNAQAAVNVSSSAGDGGGLAANVNRWRKQLGLPELSNEELAKSARPIQTTSGRATLVEMSGHDARNGQPASLVGAMVVQTGQAWFYKLMGDAKIVAAQKEAFTQFVQEVKY